MPRYFFDLYDDRPYTDDEGTECEGSEAARREAMASLPEISRWLIPAHGDNQTFSVVVRDESGVAFYKATLTFTGVSLCGDASSS